MPLRVFAEDITDDAARVYSISPLKSFYSLISHPLHVHMVISKGFWILHGLLGPLA